MCEVARKHFGHAGSIRRGMAGAYDRDRRECEQLRIAAEPKHGRRIKYLAETFGISVVGIGEKLAAGFRERIELLIGRRACMAVGDELNALDRKLQGFKIGETTFDDFRSRPAALNCTQNASRTQLWRKGKSEPRNSIFGQRENGKLVRDCGCNQCEAYADRGLSACPIVDWI